MQEPIAESRISTKVLLDAYTHLQDSLEDQCSEDFCPHIEINFNTCNWHKIGKKKENRTWRIKRTRKFCSFCQVSWDTDFCPCVNDLDPVYIFARLNEVIEQLQNKLSKEFSS